MLSISSAVDLAEGLPLIDHPVQASLSTSIACIEWAVNDTLKEDRANPSVVKMSFEFQEPSDIIRDDR